MSPFELMLRKSARYPVDVQTGVPLSEPEATTEFEQRLKKDRALTKEFVERHIVSAQRRQKENYDQKTFSQHHYMAGDL